MAERGSSCDVVVVGSGAAGSVVAARLAEAGCDVIILEAGPAWSAPDLYNSLVWGRRLRWGGERVLAQGADPFAHQFNTGWGLGGSALHHYACWPRLAIEDFRENTLYGRGTDWPIEYETVRRFYDRVQAEVGISGDARLEVWRPPGEPYPMPPLAVFPHAQILAAGFHRLGLRTAPQPMAINSQPYKGRPACQYDGWCDSGCSILALANPLAVYLPRARKAGARIVARAAVRRVLASRRTDRVYGVEWIDARGDVQQTQAGLVVLAANAIQNARLLLNSASSQHPAGLANSSGLVGRYFMYHTNVSIVGEFDVETFNSMGPVAGTVHSRDGAKLRSDGLFGSVMWHIGLSIKPNDVIGMADWRPDLIGAELAGFLEHRAPRMANLVALCQVGASVENRIELDSAKDRWGVPLARTIVALDQNDRALLKNTANLGLRVCGAAGAREAWIAGFGNSHAIGGTRMGLDRRASVTDGFGFTHDIANLAIVGSGIFPAPRPLTPLTPFTRCPYELPSVLWRSGKTFDQSRRRLPGPQL